MVAIHLLAARASRFRGAFGVVAVCLLLLYGAGCQSAGGRAVTDKNLAPTVLVLTPGDVLEIKFPGATTLSGQFKIGPEGFLSMPLIGQVDTTGKTARELQDHLEELYEKQLQDKEVIVTMAESANVVYVTGAVLSPGKVEMARPLTALDAVMEKGGFNLDQANMKKVTVIRYEEKTNTVYHLNMEPILSGGPVAPFYLQPRDIVHVPQKVRWF
jgi:polysaccharide export outer membrane protein